MKKFAAWIAVMVLLIGLLSVGVQAEGFAFVEIKRDYDEYFNATQMIVTWNFEDFGEGDELESVLVGGQEMTFDIQDGKLLVDIASLDAGVYPVEYVYIPADGEQTSVQGIDLIKNGDAEVTLSHEIRDDGTVTVKAVNGSGVPVAGYQLSLTVGSIRVNGTTDAQGAYVARYRLSYGDTLMYEGKETYDGVICYAAVEQKTVVREQPVTTTPPTSATTTTMTQTTTEVTTTTTETTTATTEATTTTGKPTVGTTASTGPSSSGSIAPGGKTNASVFGPGTTSTQKDQVALNVSTDTGMLALFGCESDGFDDQARFLVSKEDYKKLVGRTGNSLMLNVLTPAEQASEAQVEEALSQNADFGEYGDKYSWVTMQTSFLMLDKEGNVVPVTAVPIDATYTVELPIPDSMSDHSTFLITLTDGDGLQEPIKITAEDGILRFGIQSMEVFTVIGFGEGGSKVGGIPTTAIVLLVVGILLLVAAGILLWLFVFRKPKEKKEETKPVVAPTPEVSGDDIFSGRTDLPPSDGD